MRNTMMRDKLVDAFTEESGVISSDRSNEEVLSALSAVQRKMKKEERKPGFLVGPRYVMPAKRTNPFSVHAYTSTFLTVDENKPRAAADPRVEVQAAKPLISSVVPEPSLQQPPRRETQIPMAGDSPSPQAPSPMNPPFVQPRTAFSPELIAMVARLRTAKAAIAFALEQLRARRKKTEEELAARQHDLEGIDRQVEHERENLRKIDDTITASTLLAEQAAAIDPGLLTSRGTHHKTAGGGGDGKRYANRWSDDPSILHIADMRSFFAEHPEIPHGKDGWDAAAIVAELLPVKQEHAKLSLPGMLKAMADAGEIERVGRGLYRTANRPMNE